MKKHRLLATMLALMFILAGCNSNKAGRCTDEIPETRMEETSADIEITERNEKTVTMATLPKELAQIPEDSGNYSLALRLTENYHRELTGDLIPTVEGTYSTYAEDTTEEGLRVSNQIAAMAAVEDGTFRYADNEKDGKKTNLIWHNMSGMVRNLIDRFYGPVPSGALKGRKFIFLFQGAAPEKWMLEKAEYTMSRFARMYGMEYVGMATSSKEAKMLSRKV